MRFVRVSPALISLFVFAEAFGSGAAQAVPPKADSACDQGIRAYNRQDYKGASAFFQQCLRGKQPTAEALYYAALTHHQLGEVVRAKQLYQSVIDKHPKSEAATLAKTALANFNNPHPAPQVEEQDALSAARPADLDSLPKETWVEFTRMGEHVVVDAEMNRHPLKMVFDTGAEVCLFSISKLARMGVTIPNRPPDAQGKGVGNAVGTPIWIVPVDLKVGKIERRNFPVCASNSDEIMPLLGQNFFKDFQYMIDDSTKAILFKRSQSVAESSALGSAGAITVNTQGHYVYSVPYTNLGREVIVTAKVNGKDCQMIFDTGASSCFFTAKQFSSLGLSISPNAQSMAIQGIAGSTMGKVCIISELKLGPIVEPNVIAAVSDNALLPMPLLGQNFFRQWKYTIDSAHKVIHFEKR